MEKVMEKGKNIMIMMILVLMVNIEWKKNGPAKEYDIDGNLQFEGGCGDGERNGKGKYCFKGKLTFDGEYLYGFIMRDKIDIGEHLEFDVEYLLGRKWDGKGYD